MAWTRVPGQELVTTKTYYQTTHAFTGAVSVGNLAIAAFCATEAGYSWSGPALTDNLGNTWTPSTNRSGLLVFYSVISHAGVPTVTWSGLTTDPGAAFAIWLDEFVPPSGVVSLDVESNTGAISCAGAGELVIALDFNFPVPTAGSGYTRTLNSAASTLSGYFVGQFNLSSSSGSQATTFSDGQVYTALAFKTSVGGATPNITSVAPTFGFRNTTQPITITGTNLGGSSPSGVTIASSSDITIQVLTIGSTSWTANVIIDTAAAAGSRTLTLSTGDGTASVGFVIKNRTDTGGGAAGDDEMYGGPLKYGAARTVYIRMVDASGAGVAGLASGLTIYAAKNGGSSAAITPTAHEVDATHMIGDYALDLTSLHADTLGFMKLYITGSGALPRCYVYDVQKTLDVSDIGAQNWADLINNGGSLASRTLGDIAKTTDVPTAVQNANQLVTTSGTTPVKTDQRRINGVVINGNGTTIPFGP